uniref:NADH dehydrogenase subunit 6 n=1 Tax=Scolytoplatypus wugongshanensis TaxID=2894162 RepID=UPI0023AAE2B0|nr:NADH dehydrogenase subunit 6 [Scolytoplatypus wugongshanensis]WCB99745.1 NADH dehydrogenase subunit 6 [Scolytoplatypus wugongshanensis]
MLFLMLLNWLFSSILLFINHPLTVGFTLLTNTILISLISGMFYLNFWFSYILFLIMISGLLIMFIYMTSIASNEKFMINKYLFIFPLLLFSFMLISLMTDIFFCMKPMNSSTIMFNDLIKNTHMNKFFSNPNMIMLLFLMVYLLLTLIMATKITDKKLGPLRQKK